MVDGVGGTVDKCKALQGGETKEKTKETGVVYQVKGQAAVAADRERGRGKEALPGSVKFDEVGRRLLKWRLRVAE